MSYIGNQPSQIAFVSDQFSGNGSTTVFTMSVAPANTASVLVIVSGVVQDPTTYSVSGTTLTFSAAPPTGTANISARYLGIPASGVTTTAYRTVTAFTATANQTTFTPPSYTPNFINVFRNGVLLTPVSDYTATNGTTVVLAYGATAGDTVLIESFYVSSILNAIPQFGGSSSNQTLTNPTIAGAGITFPYGANPQAAPAKVLQVVQGSVIGSANVVYFTTTSSSYVNTGLAASITPLFSTSKILVIVSPSVFGLGAALDSGVGLGIARASTTIASTSRIAVYANSTGVGGQPCFSYLDSPATTSSTTYNFQLCAYQNNGGTTAYLNRNYQATEFSTITLMEIAQ